MADAPVKPEDPKFKIPVVDEPVTAAFEQLAPMREVLKQIGDACDVFTPQREAIGIAILKLRDIERLCVSLKDAPELAALIHRYPVIEDTLQKVRGKIDEFILQGEFLREMSRSLTYWIERYPKTQTSNSPMPYENFRMGVEETDLEYLAQNGTTHNEPIAKILAYDNFVAVRVRFSKFGELSGAVTFFPTKLEAQDYSAKFYKTLLSIDSKENVFHLEYLDEAGELQTELMQLEL